MIPIIGIMVGIGVVNTAWMGIKVKELAIDQGKRDLKHMSETVFGVMTGYMVTGAMADQKKPFLDHMNKMLPVRMIRGDLLDSQYGKKNEEDLQRKIPKRRYSEQARPSLDSKQSRESLISPGYSPI